MISGNNQTHIDTAVDKIRIAHAMHYEYFRFLDQYPNDASDFKFCTDMSDICVIVKQTLRLRKLL